MEQLTQGTVRHVRADFRRRLPVAEPAVAVEGRIRAVRPALLLPQDEEEPRIRPAAEHLGRDAAGIVDRVGRQDGRVAERDVGLRRARPVHEQEIGRDPCSGSGQGRARRGRAAPARERLCHEVPHHQQRPDRPQPLPGELCHVVTGDGAIALARRAPPVGVAAVDLAPEEALRHGARLGQLQRKRGQRPRACQLHLVVRERRVQGHVPQQIEHEPRLVAQRLGRDGEEILRRGRR